MAEHYDENEKTANLLLISFLLLLICCTLGAMAYFSYTLGIFTPPGASDTPGRIGSGGSGTGVATPGGSGEADQTGGVEEIIFPGFVSFSLTDAGDTVSMKNDGTNQVYFRILFTDEQGASLYASDNIQPGGMEQWKVTSSFDPGTGKHQVNVTVDAFAVADDTPCNGLSSTFWVDMG